MTETNGGQNPIFSLDFESLKEAEFYKWLASERAGRDLGPDACQEWWRQFWDIYCRWRLVDHLYGRKKFKEFHDRAFGCLRDPEFASDPVVQFIIKHFLEDLWENIHFFSFSWNRNLPREPLFEALELFRINDGRHTPPTWLNVGKA